MYSECIAHEPFICAGFGYCELAGRWSWDNHQRLPAHLCGAFKKASKTALLGLSLSAGPAAPASSFFLCLICCTNQQKTYYIVTQPHTFDTTDVSHTYTPDELINMLHKVSQKKLLVMTYLCAASLFVASLEPGGYNINTRVDYGY